MWVKGKGVAMEPNEQLIKGLWWVGLALLIASFDHIKRQPVAKLVSQATFKQILRDSLRLRRKSGISLVHLMTEGFGQPLG